MNNLPFEKRSLIISMLAENASIRACERITGVHRDTIMRLAVRVGDACETILSQKMIGLNCKVLEVDELWGFIGKKQKRTTPAERNEGRGDVWTFIALDVDTKIIPSYLIGKRDAYHARAFMDDLAGRITQRFQLSTDQLHAYPDAVERAWGSQIDYAQIVKTYGVVNLNKDAASRYSPAEVVKVQKHHVMGNPVKELVSTSHVEKQNHTLRMHCRRLSRLTNAFSKKIENFKAAVALNFAYYNFCKTHGAIRMTPAQAAGIEASAWTVDELMELCGE
ncbi:MAG TPA: IS1 family transposase [Verrucomicrobiae bacterium]|jgi:IS1 family transposase